MKRILLLAAMVWFLGIGIADALVLRVKPEGDKGDVVLRLGMTNEEYKSAAGLMGGQNPVTDSSIPGMNEVNVAVPFSAQQYSRMRTDAAQEAAGGPDWCVTCASDKNKFNVKAKNAFGAALIGAGQCEEKSKSQDLDVAGPGSCALEGK